MFFHKPNKEPPQELFSFPSRKGSFVSSIAAHLMVTAILVFVLPHLTKHDYAGRAVYIPSEQRVIYLPLFKKPGPSGGGGGGDRSPLPANKGKLPKFSRRQFVLPQTVPKEPKLIMESSPRVQTDNLEPPLPGDLIGQIGRPSTGPGSGGGIGPGEGPGLGPGSGGGHGGGVYGPGAGVTSPTLIFKVDPEYSEEARRAKAQGLVVLSLEVDEKGLPQHIKVLRGVGLGLDEKAVEAVGKWKFMPGLIISTGKPVTIKVMVEVRFTLL